MEITSNHSSLPEGSLHYTAFLLANKGLLTSIPKGSQNIEITSLGIKKFKKEDFTRQRASEEKELQFQKLKIDVKNAKRIFKTYWLTFGMAAFASFLDSLLSDALYQY